MKENDIKMLKKETRRVKEKESKKLRKHTISVVAVADLCYQSSHRNFTVQDKYG